MKRCIFSIIPIALTLVFVASVAVPQETAPAHEKQCKLTVNRKKESPLASVPRLLHGHCEFFASKKECAKGLTMPVATDECPNEFDLPVPCCLEGVTCDAGWGRRGLCMNTNKPCKNGYYLESDECPTPSEDIRCCSSVQTEDTGNDGQDKTSDSKGVFTDDKVANDVIPGEALYDPLSGMDLQASTAGIFVDADNPAPAAPLSYDSFSDNSQQAQSGDENFATTGDSVTPSTNWVD